jgi:hypothetical protein
MIFVAPVFINTEVAAYMSSASLMASFKIKSNVSLSFGRKQMHLHVYQSSRFRKMRIVYDDWKPKVAGSSKL